jgi:hypothetical protein
MPVSNSRTGQVTAFDPSTGASTIVVDGQEMTDLAVDVVGAVPLQVGDYVQIDTSTPRWYVKGKISEPGAGVVPTWPADIEQASADAAAAQASADALQGAIDAAEAAVAAVEASLATLNTVTLPGLQSALDTAEADVAAATASLATLNSTTLPALSADVDAVEANITTLTGTTIPTLQTQVNGILPITTTKISDDAITTPKIATDAVTAAKIQADAVTAVKILAGAVTTAKLDAGAVTAVKIAADTITAAQIAAGAITASELAANAVTAGKIAAGTIVAGDISAGAITTAKIATDAVTANEIAAGAITATEIQAGAITGTKLSADAIDGKTITGATFLTAAPTNARWELSSAHSNQLLGYPASNVNNPQPGVLRIDSQQTEPNKWLYETRLTAPTSTAVPSSNTNNPYFRLAVHEATGGTAVSAVGESGSFTDEFSTLGMLWNKGLPDLYLYATTGVVKANDVPVATTTGTQTLTNKTIAGGKLGAAGSAVSGLRFGQAAAQAINGSGQITISHGLGVQPTTVIAVGANHAVRVQAQTSTTFTVVCYTLPGATLATTGTGTIFWIAII